MGSLISADYKGRDLLIIGILKAACIFTADIIRDINIPLKLDFLRVVSYSGKASSGKPKIIWNATHKMIFNKDILLLDTVLDTGLTMHTIVDHIGKLKPRSLDICVLLVKDLDRTVDIDVKYKGFVIPDDFIIGYGMDMDGSYRNLPYIATYP